MPPKRKSSGTVRRKATRGTIRAAHEDNPSQLQNSLDDLNDDAETGAETRKSPSKKARTSLVQLKSEVESLKNDIQTIKYFIMKGNKPSQVCSPVTGPSTFNLTKDQDSDQATETSTQTSVSL